MLNGVGTAGKKVVTRVTPLDQSGSTRQWEHKRVVDVLGLTDGGDRNEATARGDVTVTACERLAR
jgi:hypothetical protein